MIVQIKSPNGSLLATHIFDWTSKERGVEFWTQPDAPLQVGHFRRGEGYEVKAHRHIGTTSIVTSTTEVLVVESGRLLATIYDQYDTKVTEIRLNPSDVLILWQGGHSFHALTEVEVLEIRQGPYRGREQDKQELEIPDATV